MVTLVTTVRQTLMSVEVTYVTTEEHVWYVNYQVILQWIITHINFVAIKMYVKNSAYHFQ